MPSVLSAALSLQEPLSLACPALYPGGGCVCGLAGVAFLPCEHTRVPQGDMRASSSKASNERASFLDARSGQCPQAVEAASCTSEAGGRGWMQWVQENARKASAAIVGREAEGRSQSDAAAKEKIDLFFKAHAYGGVNWRRTTISKDTWQMKSKYPLHTAVKQGDAEMITLLLRARADPSVKDSDGMTPLQLAENSKNEGLANAFALGAHGDD